MSKTVNVPEGTNLNNLNASKNFGVLKTRTFNQSIEDAKHQSIPNRLFSDFIYENEITFLFSDTNTGKSVLAVQLGESIATGRAIHPAFPVDCEGQKVLYMDFEMTDKQIEKRYSRDWQNHYQFSDNFLRATIDYDYEIPDNFSLSQSVLMQVSSIVHGTDAKVIIIDNLTYLNEDFEKAKAVLPLMRLLKKLKDKLGLTLIVLAHTPKIGHGQPVMLNHLAGSKQLANFIDAAFAIGRCADDIALRYLKQVKTRSESIYHKDNVPVFELAKIGDGNFLAFNFLDRFCDEYSLITESKEKERENIEDEVILLSKEGKSGYAISKTLGISQSSVYRIIEKNK